MAVEQQDEPRFAIGLVAEMVEAHPQTLRMYERSGLIVPSRSRGNVRLYTRRDIRRIQRIQSFTQMGVNLAGIEIIFRLLERIEELEGELERRREAERRQSEQAAEQSLRARLRREAES